MPRWGPAREPTCGTVTTHEIPTIETAVAPGIARAAAGGRSERDEDRVFDPRDVFVRAVDLPLDVERELVRDRDRTYELNGTDSRVLATVGAFRVVAESDLERAFDNPASARDSVKHLEAEGLLSRSRSGPDERVTFLSNRGRDLLEASRWERDDRSRRPDQAFYAGLRKPRELGHDSQVYRAYLRAEERLRSAGGRVRRVVLDYELKRDYQRFLQERNRDRADSDGRPDRSAREIQAWAREHRLPYFDERVHFPDPRIEYEDRERYLEREDIEVVTAPLSRRPCGGRCALRLRAIPRRRRPRRRTWRWARGGGVPRGGGVAMSLAPAAEPWRIEHANRQRADALAAFGFTERQARFLVQVLLHAGVFVERQYAHFAGITHGQKTTDFLDRLVDRKYATPIATGALHRGRLFHVHYKPLWSAIGEPDSRFRKPAKLGRLIERVMLLDAVLADRELMWLGPSADKLSFFVSEGNEAGRLRQEEYPHICFGEGPTKVARYFPDKLPIGVKPYGSPHVFLYLVTKPSPADFRAFRSVTRTCSVPSTSGPSACSSRGT